MNIQQSLINFQRKIKERSVEFDLSSYEAILTQINQLEAKYERLSLYGLQQVAKEQKHQVQYGGVALEELLPEAFALVREVCKRKLNMRPYDVQVLAGIVLHQGKLAEMKTGEGKTLAAVMPVYLNALSGKGVHLMTFNDYLAQRDANWMRPVYESLGLSVGYLQEEMPRAERAKAYQCDITYATAREIGFDYLRECMVYDKSECIQRGFHFVIVDEADALLIDEARNPLVLAGTLEAEYVDLHRIAQHISTLKRGVDFMMEGYDRNVYLTEEGIDQLESHFEIENLHGEEHHALLAAINLALHAKMLLHKDVDYIVRDGMIKLVDEFTGRIVEDRKWQNGLQVAVEAKEGLEIQSQGSILGSISLQLFVKMYRKLACMTATAREAAAEFEEVYKLNTVIIPPNKLNNRGDLPDLLFTHKDAKLTELLNTIRQMHTKGRPVLIGTLTVKESEEIADLLRVNNIPCKVLNAKEDEKEAEIIAEAGAWKAVTISTNMAGRGTDIVLGGKDGSDRERIVALGGLHVIGTNRHESRRIDNQLRGRAARQGDPGSSQFIISMDDPLMVKYKLNELILEKFGDLQQDMPVEIPHVHKKIAQAQRVIEGQMQYMRSTLYAYTAFVEEERRVFLSYRDKVVLGEFEIDTSNKALREYLLQRYDDLWVKHLAFITEIRESIHLVRLGGEEPLRVFQRKALDHFYAVESQLQELEDQFLHDNLETHIPGLVRPSSTWTYIVNDNPFQKNGAMMLLNNANMGFQIDPFTGPLLVLMRLFKKKRRF